MAIYLCTASIGPALKYCHFTAAYSFILYTFYCVINLYVSYDINFFLNDITFHIMQCMHIIFTKGRFLPIAPVGVKFLSPSNAQIWINERVFHNQSRIEKLLRILSNSTNVEGPQGSRNYYNAMLSILLTQNLILFIIF